MKQIFIVLCSAALLSCAKQNFEANQVGTASRSLTATQSAQVVTYLSNQLEAASIAALDSSYYNQIVDPDSLAGKEAEIWSLWAEANADRLTTFPAAISDSVNFTWGIPQNQQMQVQVFAKGGKPSTGYPFLINLHGGGQYNVSGPWAAFVNSAEWRNSKRLSQQFADSPSLYFVPRMADDRIGRWYLRPQQTAFLRAWQLAVLSGQVDPNKTYITGISEGGYGSFRLGTFYADYFAGIGPMAGPETPEAAPIENLRNTAIRIEVGERDVAFGRIFYGEAWQQRLDSAAAANPGQFDHEVVIQAGSGHVINYTNVTPWLVQKTRNVYPETLSFMYYNMDGGYRNGFGYVRLDGLTRNGGRKSFKIVKQGNTYDISTADVSGSVTGKIALYLENIDYTAPVTVTLNGQEVFRSNVECSVGVMVESVAVFGDPNRIFASKVMLDI